MDSKDSDQTGWMPRLIQVFAGRTKATEIRIICRHLPDNRSGRLINFVRLAEFLADLILGSNVSQAISCQTYGLAQMKMLPDLPKLCLVCLAGPAVNDNTAVILLFLSCCTSIMSISSFI